MYSANSLHVSVLRRQHMDWTSKQLLLLTNHMILNCFSISPLIPVAAVLLTLIPLIPHPSVVLLTCAVSKLVWNLYPLLRITCFYQLYGILVCCCESVFIFDVPVSHSLHEFSSSRLYIYIYIYDLSL